MELKRFQRFLLILRNVLSVFSELFCVHNDVVIIRQLTIFSAALCQRDERSAEGGELFVFGA